MYAYQVNDMTCGHCAGVITKAVLAVDGGATVDVDLGTRLVQVDSSGATEDALRQAIQAAGYEVVASKPTSERPEAQRAGGCCCGSGAAHCGT